MPDVARLAARRQRRGRTGSRLRRRSRLAASGGAGGGATAPRGRRRAPCRRPRGWRSNGARTRRIYRGARTGRARAGRPTPPEVRPLTPSPPRAPGLKGSDPSTIQTAAQSQNECRGVRPRPARARAGAGDLRAGVDPRARSTSGAIGTPSASLGVPRHLDRLHEVIRAPAPLPATTAGARPAWRPRLVVVGLGGVAELSARRRGEPAPGRRNRTSWSALSKDPRAGGSRCWPTSSGRCPWTSGPAEARR